MYRLCFVLVLLTSGALGAGFGRWQFDRGLPGTSQTESTANPECKKDLLLIVDTSYSIGQADFDENVKPFLVNLIKHPLLDVGPNRTHVGLILFSSEAKTLIRLGVEDITDPYELAEYMGNLNYGSISGDRTRTELALKLAKDKVFTKTGPANFRPDVDDAIVLLTDGEPRGKTDTLELTKQYAQKLKEKNILIVAAGVGRQSDNEKFQKVLSELATSSKFFVKAKFDQMNNILDKLVAKSCIKPGQCSCAKGGIEGTFYVKNGQSQAKASWPTPTFTCATGGEVTIEKTTVDPPVTSLSRFSPGTHDINYIFQLQGDVTVTCSVTIHVIGEKCGSGTYNPATEVCCSGKVHKHQDNSQCCGQEYAGKSEVCCSGKVHKRQYNFECCGQEYADTSDYRCCYIPSLTPIDETCHYDMCSDHF